MGNIRTNNNRIEWIDVARGYGILFIMLGHLPAGKLVDEVYTFHLPLFFILSGYLFSGYKLEPLAFIKKSVRTLLIPYFFMGIILQTCSWAFFEAGDVSRIKDYLIELLVQNRLHTIWFLTCLFVAQIFFYIITKYMARNKIQVLSLSTMLAGVGLAYYYAGGGSLPWNIDASLIATFFLAVGFCFNGVDIKFSKMNFLGAVLINIVCTIANYSLVGCQLEMFNMHYGVIPFTLAGCLAGVYAVCFVSNAKPFKSINYIGKHSMLYFGLHQGVTMPVVDIALYALGFDIARFGLIQNVIYIVISMLFSLGAITLLHMGISRTKLKFLIAE